MSDNLAEQSLGLPDSSGPLTLTEKRKAYEDWLQSGRRTPKPASDCTHAQAAALPAHRVDDLPSKVDLRSKAEVEAASKLLNPTPPGAVVRTDDEFGTLDAHDVSDDLRLNFGKVLLTKAEGADAETATRIANAANALLGPMVRADDDADLKNKVLEKKADNEEEKPRKVQDNAEEDGPDGPKGPSLADVMVALGKLDKRIDTLEGKKNENGEEEDDSGSEDIPTRGAPGPEGTPKALAADDDYYGKLRRKSLRVRMSKDKEGRAAFDSMHTDVLFFPYQAMADKHYAMLGSSAPKPMYGELRDNYRRRLLTPLQRFSPTFKDADLRVAQVDPVAFDAIEKDIYKCAADAFKNPETVPLGHLREHVETRGGHIYTKFYGRPISWMATFAPTGKRVRRIIERSDSGANRTLYERN